MKWYAVKKEYIDYLKKWDKKIPNVDYGNRMKCFIGVIFIKNDIEYFAPLTSFKEKFISMKNDIDFYKITNYETGKIYGAIDINNMIPIPKEMYTEITFENLESSDLIVDTIYKGGDLKGKASEVISKLLPNCSNSGGFRKVMRKDNSGLPAYVVLYTSMSELAWPDYLDEETGIFRYYGDNRTPGKTILDTPRKGNGLLELVFECLNSKDGSIQNISPFLIFKKGAIGWDVQ